MNAGLWSSPAPLSTPPSSCCGSSHTTDPYFEASDIKVTKGHGGAVRRDVQVAAHTACRRALSQVQEQIAQGQDQIWLRPAMRHVLIVPGTAYSEGSRKHAAMQRLVQALSARGASTYYAPATTGGVHVAGAEGGESVAEAALIRNPDMKRAAMNADQDVKLDVVLLLPGAALDAVLSVLRPGAEAPPVVCLSKQSGAWPGELEHVCRGTTFLLRRRLQVVMTCAATSKPTAGMQPQPQPQPQPPIDVLCGVTVACSTRMEGAMDMCESPQGWLDVAVDGQALTSLPCGLRISLPSDPMSIWMGAPLVHPCVPAILLVPLCPSHSLSLRPLILPLSSVIRITAAVPRGHRHRSTGSLTWRDQHHWHPPTFLLQRGDSLRLRVAPSPLPVLEQDWFEVVRDLGWNQ